MAPLSLNRARLTRHPFRDGLTVLMFTLLIVAIRGWGQSISGPGKAGDSAAEAAKAAGLITRVERLEAQRIRPVRNVYVVSRKSGQGAGSKVVGPGPQAKPYYSYPQWPEWSRERDFNGPNIERFKTENWLTIVDDQGKPLDFGEEVTDVVVVPHRRFAELAHFWEIEARPDPENRSRVQLVALGSYGLFQGTAIGFQLAPANPALEPSVHVDLIVSYREKRSM